MQDAYLLGSFKFSHITLKNPLNGVIDFQLKAGHVQLLKPKRNRSRIIRREMRNIPHTCRSANYSFVRLINAYSWPRELYGTTNKAGAPSAFSDPAVCTLKGRYCNSGLPADFTSTQGLDDAWEVSGPRCSGDRRKWIEEKRGRRRFLRSLAVKGWGTTL